MKVLVITTSYPSPCYPTSGIFVSNLVAAMKSLATVNILTPAPDNTTPHPDSNVLFFSYAPKPMRILAHRPGGIPVALKKNKALYLLLPSFLFSMFLATVRHAKRVDIIHANWTICGYIAILAGIILRVPVVTTVRGEDMERASSSRIDRILLNFCVKHSKKIVSVSFAFRDHLLRSYPKSESKFTCIENGVADDFFQIKKTTQHRKFLRMVTVCSLIRRKSVETILYSVHDTNHTELTIVGDGPEKKHLMRLCEKLHIQNRVNFVGEYSQMQIASSFSEHDIFVLASLSEGRPNAVLEAMAASMCVVATNIPGTREIVLDNKTGLLFPPGADKKLSRILEICQDESLRKRLGNAARRSLVEKKLTWESCAEQYYELYHSLLP